MKLFLESLILACPTLLRMTHLGEAALWCGYTFVLIVSTHSYPVWIWQKWFSMAITLAGKTLSCAVYGADGVFYLKSYFTLKTEESKIHRKFWTIMNSPMRSDGLDSLTSLQGGADASFIAYSIFANVIDKLRNKCSS